MSDPVFITAVSSVHSIIMGIANLSSDVRMDEPWGPAVHSLTRYQMESTVINDLRGYADA